jgi:uncharacterized protein YlxW (UPF0749 family)
MKNRIVKDIAITVVCILLGTMLAWQYKSINNRNSITSYQNVRQEQLKDELIQLQDNYASLNKRFMEIMEENEIMRAKGADSDSIREDLMKNLQRVKTFAGLLPVKGPGLIITLKENGKMIWDEDLLQLVNELRAADAQAICINEERIVAMSEIRTVSSLYMMINGNRTSAPYIVKVIGDSEKMEHSLKMMGGVIEDFTRFGLDVTVERSESILIPAVKDDGSVIKTDLLTPAE